MPHIIIDDVVVDLQRKKMKNLRIAINPALGQVRVSAPLRLKDETIQNFIMAKMPWIKKHLAKFSASPKPMLEKITSEQREQLLENIQPLVEKYEKIMGVSVSEFRIKQMKTRWGTCNTRARRIWINVELVRKSQACLEYIVVHEMVHLLERSHNARFKAFMDKFLPQWRLHRAELKHFGS
jgi:predicted metal-dependent hydrolase